MSDSEDQYMSDAASSDFVPTPAKKGAVAKPKAAAAAKPKAKPAAAKANGAAAKKAPLAARKSNEGTPATTIGGDDDADFSPIAVSKTTTATGTKKTATETYQKLSQLEHVLKRPDTYIGSVEMHTQKLWVFDSVSKQMAFRDVTYVPGFYKIFDEILVNAADNKVRDATMDTLKVTIDKSAGTVSVWNNGRGIPIEMHEKENVYIPELIFGHLLTSSNYDDDEAKVTGGRNGYGAKLANIYSTEFTVETANADTQKRYTQTFTDNMSKKGKAKVLKFSGKGDYTQITFKPDLARFRMGSIDADIEALMMKRVYDMAGTVKDIKVWLNGERLPIKSFKAYCDMYVKAINELSAPAPAVGEDGEPLDVAAPAVPKQTLVYEQTVDKGKTWEVAFAVSDGEFRQVSFVNNIATTKGGRHVDMCESQIVAKIMEHVKKNKKNGPVQPKQIRDQLWIFVNCQIVNPTFDGQTKEELTLKWSAFGSKWNMTDSFASKVLKSGVIDNVLSMAKFKQEQAMKKTDGKKRTRITGIPKLEDANNAGGRKAKDCTLILTEGDSAKALAVSGLAEVGRDNFGVFPLRGKLLNVRDASHDAITKNAEISSIKTIMGLQHNKQYTGTETLRYGSLMIMTDQDHDGSHIKGLIINFLDYFFPSLLKQPNFLVEFITPIVKCTKGKQEISFFTIPEYEAWKAAHDDGRGWTIKYYKGLGTSTSADAKKYFRAMDKHMLRFATTQEGDRQLIDLAFNKKKADERKEWLRNFKSGTYLDHNIDEVPMSDFINKELVLFSMADNMRSIPSMIDGLKPGQRKVMFGCFKRKLKAEIKVAQLGGYVSEHSAYHHGEASLYMTIVNLAQDFVGANNVNLLSPNGQFGTRLMGGKDAASARYIFTNLPRIARTIFHPADEALLNYLNDDGQSIEPETYYPTVPLVLINGAEGIGTGWSTSIPNYNPTEIVANIRRRLAGEEMVPMHPWYRDFNGTIEQVASDKYKCSGNVVQLDEKTYRIDELPIRTWTSPYKESVLEPRLAGTDKVPSTIHNIKERHTDTRVHFEVELNARGQAEVAKDPDGFWKTTTTISTSNMVVFGVDGKIKKYASPLEILDDWYLVRLEMYQKRKDNLVKELKLVYERLSNQARFVHMIINRQLQISNRPRKDIVADLRKHDFRPFPKETKAQIAADVEDNRDEDEIDEPAEASGGYDYLLSMAIYSLTAEKYAQLMKQRDAKEADLTALLQRTPQNLWDEDLTAFLDEWNKLLDDDDKRNKDMAKKIAGKGLAKGKGRKVKGDDDDSEDDFKPTKAAPKKRSPAKPKAESSVAKKTSPPTAGVKRSGSAALDDDDLAALVSTKAAAPAAKKLKQGKLNFAAEAADDSMDQSADYIVAAPAPRKPSTAKAGASSRSASSSAAAAKKKAISIDESDVSLDGPAPPPRARAGRAKAPVKYAADSEQDDDDDDDDF